MSHHCGYWDAPGHSGIPGKRRKQQIPHFSSCTASNGLRKELGEKGRQIQLRVSIHSQAINSWKIRTYKATLGRIPLCGINGEWGLFLNPSPRGEIFLMVKGKLFQTLWLMEHPHFPAQQSCQSCCFSFISHFSW